MSQNQPRIAITGLGVLSALGTGKEAFFDFLCRRTDDQPLADREQPLVNRLGIRDPRFKISRYLDPGSKNAIVALDDALSDAGIESDSIKTDPYNYALVFGTQRGPLATRKMLYDGFEKKGRKLISGTLFSHCGYNMAAAMTAVGYSIKGPNLTLSARSDLGICLLHRANQLIASRRVHTAFVGFSASTEESGFSDELAYILVLENMTHAMQRNADNLVAFEEMGCDALTLQPGKMYTCEHVSDFSQAQLLDTQVHESHVMSEQYLPLIKLGMLAGDQKNSTLLMPTRTKNGCTMMTLRKTDAF